MEPHRLLGFASIAIIMLVVWAWSEDRRNIPWRLVAYSLITVFVIQVLCLRVPGASDALLSFSTVAGKANAYAMQGCNFVLTDDVCSGKFLGHDHPVFIFGIQIFGTIVFICSICEVGYWSGIVQIIVKGFGFLLQKLGLSGAEAMALGATPIMGQIESALVVRPYVPLLTPSQLFTYMVGSMASTAGGTMILYIMIGMRPQWIIAATFSHLFSGIMLAKMKRPDKAIAEGQSASAVELEPSDAHGLFGAILTGGLHGVSIGAKVIFAVGLFIAWVFMVQDIFAGITGWFGSSLTLTDALGYVLTPVAYMLGVDWSDLFASGKIISIGSLTNEVLAMIDFVKSAKAGQLSEHTQCILTFAITLFAHPGSIGIQIGGLSAMAPDRKSEITANAWRAMLVATMAAWLSASVCSIII